MAVSGEHAVVQNVCPEHERPQQHHTRQRQDRHGAAATATVKRTDTDNLRHGTK
jgi:hypothetical protein